MDIPKETRRESYGAVLPTVAARQNMVLMILRESGEMTAQEIASELHRRGLTPSDERKSLTTMVATNPLFTSSSILRRLGRLKSVPLKPSSAGVKIKLKKY